MTNPVVYDLRGGWTAAAGDFWTGCVRLGLMVAARKDSRAQSIERKGGRYEVSKEGNAFKGT